MPIIAHEATVSNIKAPDSQTLTLGLTVFPSSDSSSRAIASFGNDETATFYSKSVYQLVDTATATINPETTIVGVSFDGPVVLTLPSSTSNPNEISITDEGGFCSPTNTITASSPGSLGSLVLSSPYSNIKTRNNGSTWIGETKQVTTVPPFVGEEGTNTTTSPDGTITSTSADGNTVYTVNPDGSTVLAVQDGAINTTTTILADGTIIEGESNWNGSSSSFTKNPDGSTVAQVDENNGATSTFTTAVDGTTTDLQVSSSGNSVNVVTSPDGTINTAIVSNNGSSETSTVNPDGSSSSFVTASNGRITITTTSVDGVEVESVYLPWKSTFTRTTTPPGSTVVESPNPYQT